jgi:hypothetical protein
MPPTGYSRSSAIMTQRIRNLNNASAVADIHFVRQHIEELTEHDRLPDVARRVALGLFQKALPASFLTWCQLHPSAPIGLVMLSTVRIGDHLLLVISERTVHSSNQLEARPFADQA